MTLEERDHPLRIDFRFNSLRALDSFGNDLEPPLKRKVLISLFSRSVYDHQIKFPLNQNLACLVFKKVLVVYADRVPLNLLILLSQMNLLIQFEVYSLTFFW